MPSRSCRSVFLCVTAGFNFCFKIGFKASPGVLDDPEPSVAPFCATDAGERAGCPGYGNGSGSAQQEDQTRRCSLLRTVFDGEYAGGIQDVLWAGSRGRMLSSTGRRIGTWVRIRDLRTAFPCLAWKICKDLVSNRKGRLLRLIEPVLYLSRLGAQLLRCEQINNG